MKDSNPAIRDIRRAQEQGSENVTWLISSTGYSTKDIENFTRTANDCGVNLVLFSTADELINYINTGDISKEEGERDRKIEYLSVFSHGKAGELWLGMKQKNAKDLQVHMSDIERIEPEAFAESSKTFFYSCGSATNINQKNFAQEWHEWTGSETVGYDGRSNYVAKDIEKNKAAIAAARKETGYDQNGAFLFPYEGDNYEKTARTRKIGYDERTKYYMVRG